MLCTIVARSLGYDVMYYSGPVHLGYDVMYYSGPAPRVLYYIVLYYEAYTEGRLDRYRIGIPRELSEIRTQPWMREGSLTCDPCHHRGPIF